MELRAHPVVVEEVFLVEAEPWAALKAVTSLEVSVLLAAGLNPPSALSSEPHGLEAPAGMLTMTAYSELLGS